MADNYVTDPGVGGLTFKSDEDVGLVHWPIIKLAWGALDVFNIVEDAAGKRIPVDSVQSGAWSVSITGSVAVTGPLTDAQLRATAVPVSGPLTDAQLRATPVPVSGTVTANAGTNLNTSALLLEATFTGRINTQGQKAMAASTPVVLASDQSVLPVSTKTDLAPAVPTTATVGVASGVAVAANASRKGLHLRNTSTAGQRISLSLNGAAVLDSGITLYSQDVFEMGEYDFDVGAINAIASAASARLSVQEFS